MPVVNEVQEANAKGKEYTRQIKLPDKTKFNVPIWDTGTQEAFLIHVEQAKGLQKVIANMIGPKSKKDAKNPNQSPPDELKASLKDALLEKKVALEAKSMAAEGFFLLYVDFLHHLPPSGHVPQQCCQTAALLPLKTQFLICRNLFVLQIQ